MWRPPSTPRPAPTFCRRLHRRCSSVDQGVSLNQSLAGNATATADQISIIDQADEADGDPEPTPPDDGGTVEVGDLATLEGPLLNVDVNVDLDTDLAAPIAGAVAANANVAAPISASVAANVLSADSVASAVSVQDAIIKQTLHGDTEATSNQDATIAQGTTQPDAGDTGCDSNRGRFVDHHDVR